jgi:hypothetical protein
VWERARHHLVFTQTILSAATCSEYGSGAARVPGGGGGTAQMLRQYPELHNAGGMELYVVLVIGLVWDRARITIMVHRYVPQKGAMAISMCGT